MRHWGLCDKYTDNGPYDTGIIVLQIHREKIRVKVTFNLPERYFC